MTLWNRAFLLHPDEPMVRRQLAAAISETADKQRASGEIEQALQLYAQALSIDAADGKSLQALVPVMLRRGNRDGAEALLARAEPVAARRGVVLAWVRAQRSALARERGDAELAAGLAASALADVDVPRTAEAMTFMAGVAETIGDADAAERYHRTALELAPFNAGALNNLAVLLLQQGRTEEARELLQRGAAIHPEDAILRGNLDRLEAE
jgi:tetratricopeptide (TPR) repeat protein